MLHNLFFYFEYELFNPSKIKSVPDYFSALLLYLCLCYVKGDPQANGCVALKCGAGLASGWCWSLSAPHACAEPPAGLRNGAVPTMESREVRQGAWKS